MRSRSIWTVFALLALPLVAPLSCSHGEGSNAPPNEADSGAGGGLAVGGAADGRGGESADTAGTGGTSSLETGGTNGGDQATEQPGGAGASYDASGSAGESTAAGSAGISTGGAAPTGGTTNAGTAGSYAGGRATGGSPANGGAEGATTGGTNASSGGSNQGDAGGGAVPAQGAAGANGSPSLQGGAGGLREAGGVSGVAGASAPWVAGGTAGAEPPINAAGAGGQGACPNPPDCWDAACAETTACQEVGYLSPPAAVSDTLAVHDWWFHGEPNCQMPWHVEAHDAPGNRVITLAWPPELDPEDMTCDFPYYLGVDGGAIRVLDTSTEPWGGASQSRSAMFPCTGTRAATRAPAGTSTV